VQLELKACEERNEHLAAISIILESLSDAKSSRMLELVTVLNEDLETTLNNQKSSLAAANSIKSRLLKLNPVALSSLDRVDDIEFDTATGSCKTSANKPPAPILPILEEARTNAVIIRMLEPADEYQVRRVLYLL
jgi:hypothetical protein